MIKRSTPILHVESVQPCLEFWETLGFEKTMQVGEGDSIVFVALEFNGMEIMYQSNASMKSEPLNPITQAVGQGPSFLFLEVQDIEQVGELLKAFEILKALNQTSYGSREITFREPGGHIVTFSQMPEQ